jgi:signal transduction histidine kinase
VLDGEFEVTKRSGRQDVVLSRRKAGEVIGEMSLLTGQPRIATVRAVRDSRVLVISKFAFEQLLACSRSAGSAMLQTMATRLQTAQAIIAQQEKLAGLGRLAAGLAHELNNPAAAAARTAGRLRGVLDRWQALSAQLDMLHIDAQLRDRLEQFRKDMSGCAATPAIHDPLTQADLEAQMQDWLEGIGVQDAWELASLFVSQGVALAYLRQLAQHFTPAQLRVVLPWLAAGCEAHTLLDEIGKSVERISELVRAVKSYSYLDQAPIQQVDVHEGLDNTLIILRHKLKAGVEVERHYAPDLPPVESYGSELNQVWTNIIDNAVDAMGGRGKITIRTYREADRVVVEITDSGPGIPEDVQRHMFEPFYTTKPQGQGTGLGLYIVRNIVVDKHGGTVHVDSKPGETIFRIYLPLRLPKP